MVTLFSSVREPKTLGGELAVLLRRDARICVKCSAAAVISRLAADTSSGRPVMTKMGSSPRTGVFMYVLVLARSALILQPVGGGKGNVQVKLRCVKNNNATLGKRTTDNANYDKVVVTREQAVLATDRPCLDP